MRLVREGQLLGGEATSEFVNEIAEKEIRRRTEVQDRLKAMSKDEVCAAYGNTLRGERTYELGEFPEVMKLVGTEANRRKLRFNESLARKGHIKMGVSECQPPLHRTELKTAH